MPMEGNPYVRFRFPRKELRRLKALAKVAGFDSPSLFTRDLLRAMLSEEGMHHPFFPKFFQAMATEKARQMAFPFDSKAKKHPGGSRA